RRISIRPQHGLNGWDLPVLQSNRVSAVIGLRERSTRGENACEHGQNRDFCKMSVHFPPSKNDLPSNILSWNLFSSPPFASTPAGFRLSGREASFWTDDCRGLNSFHPGVFYESIISQRKYFSLRRAVQIAAQNLMTLHRLIELTYSKQIG
ncbi:MAG TPA: hypothetical protein VEO02_01155, partial [Thermoanaerobaculia bacterium]|nr:hypothetical protein [Thermoanaerobaculia bacterium]